MKRMNQLLVMMYIAISAKVAEFKEREDGDTNFISILIIVGIVVVLAGLFLTLGRGVMTDIGKKVTDFIKGLK